MLGKDVIISITSECYKTHVFTQPVVMFPRWWEQYSIDQQPELPSPWAHCLWPTMLSEPGLCAAVHLYLSGDWHQLVIHGEFCIQYFLGDFSSDQNNATFCPLQGRENTRHFALCYRNVQKKRSKSSLADSACKTTRLMFAEGCQT